MARPPSPEQFAALQRIRECVAEHGEEVGVRLARADFPKVNKTTWSRWRKQIREEDARFASAPSPVSAPVPVRTEPLRPSELVVESGVIDLFRELSSLLEDCDLLRNYAAPVDPTTGRRKVRNPMMTVQAARLRVTVLDLAQRHSESAWNIERIRAYNAQIIDLISVALNEAGDQELTRKIIGAMRAMRDRHEESVRYLGGERQAEMVA